MFGLNITHLAAITLLGLFAMTSCCNHNTENDGYFYDDPLLMFELEGDTLIDIEDTAVYQVVDIDPSFPGGLEVLSRFIQNNIQYPQKAQKNNTAGRVMVKFVVEKDGRLSNVTVLRDIGDGCGEEAVRLVKSMPKWIPGTIRHYLVRTECTIPIAFYGE